MFHYGKEIQGIGQGLLLGFGPQAKPWLHYDILNLEQDRINTNYWMSDLSEKCHF